MRARARLERHPCFACQTESFGQQTDGVPLGHATHSTLDIADASGTHAGALRHLLLGQASSGPTASKHLPEGLHWPTVSVYCFTWLHFCHRFCRFFVAFVFGVAQSTSREMERQMAAMIETALARDTLSERLTQSTRGMFGIVVANVHGLHLPATIGGRTA